MQKEKKIGKTGFFILSVILILITIIAIVGYSVAPKTIALEESEIFDEEAVKQMSEEVIGLVSVDDYSLLLNSYADEKLGSEVSMEAIRAAKDTINPEWGAMMEIIKEDYYEVGQGGTNYAMAIMNVKYENVTITYTLTFDVAMKLAGLYIK